MFIYNQLNMTNCVQFININTSTCQSTFYNSTVFHSFFGSMTNGRRKEKRWKNYSKHWT